MRKYNRGGNGNGIGEALPPPTLFRDAGQSTGFRHVSQTWHGVGCFMKAIAIRFGPAACNIALSATGWWIRMKSSPSFSRRSQRRETDGGGYSGAQAAIIVLPG